MDIAPGAPATLASGSTLNLTATAFTRENRSLGSAAVTWSSSSDATASVTGGVVTARLVGSATITATAGSASASVVISVTPGTASQLAVRAQPAGAASGAALTTQPVVEVRDAAGNLVTSSTAQVTATLASGGGTLSGASSVAAVGGVATFADLSLSGLVGARTLAFSAAGLQGATSGSFTLAAGVATQLAIRTQPVAATAYAAFTTPAVVELRDAAGNAAASTAPVSAALATGGGTLGGTTTVNAVAGVATFTNLTVNGVAGARTLAFSSGTFAAVTTESFNVAAAPPAIISFTPATVAVSVARGSNADGVDVQVRNTGVFPLTNLRVQSTTLNPVSPAGWISAAFPSGITAPATLRLTFNSAALAVGTYTASIVIAGDGAAATTSLTVNLTVALPLTNTYGNASNKISLVAIGSNISPGLVTTSLGTPTTTDATVTYASRSTATATVDATGRITGVAAGQAWIVASSTVTAADSVLVIVPRSTGVVLRGGLTAFSYRVNDIVTMQLQMDTRGATVGSVIATVSWPTVLGLGTQPNLTFLDITTTGSPLAPTSSLDNSVQVLRIIGGSSAGVTGIVDIATIRFRVARSGNSSIFATSIEVLGPDLSNLSTTATSTSYPVIVP